jgi:hypothetical protein
VWLDNKLQRAELTVNTRLAFLDPEQLTLIISFSPYIHHCMHTVVGHTLHAPVLGLALACSLLCGQTPHRSLTQETARLKLAGSLDPGSGLEDEEQLDLLLGRFPIHRESVLSTVGSCYLSK